MQQEDLTDYFEFNQIVVIDRQHPGVYVDYVSLSHFIVNPWYDYLFNIPGNEVFVEAMGFKWNTDIELADFD